MQDPVLTMILQSYVPGRPLGDFVELFWSCSESPSLLRGQILPKGTIEVIINLGEREIRIQDHRNPDRCQRHAGAVVCGAYSSAFVTEHAERASVIGVHFRPGGASPFLNVPAGELAETHVDLETLWGRAAIDLRERLCEAMTSAECFSLLEQALTARLTDATDRHRAIPIALAAFEQSDASVQIRDVARQVGLSQRRFIQVFATDVGLTPKLYSRVRRFQRALRLVNGVSAPDWARVALDGGYCDQSHLIRDFRAFAGLTPEEYLRRRNGPVPHDHVLPVTP
ncbi:MAG: helix-turn-helix domain-containing protein [Planctomycetaceae bacterium]